MGLRTAVKWKTTPDFQPEEPKQIPVADVEQSTPTFMQNYVYPNAMRIGIGRFPISGAIARMAMSEDDSAMMKDIGIGTGGRFLLEKAFGRKDPSLNIAQRLIKSDPITSGIQSLLSKGSQYLSADEGIAKTSGSKMMRFLNPGINRVTGLTRGAAKEMPGLMRSAFGRVPKGATAKMLAGGVAIPALLAAIESMAGSYGTKNPLKEASEDEGGM